MKLPSGWLQSKLSDITQSLGGGTPSKADPDFWTNGTIPWVSPKDMKVFKLISSEDKLTTKALDRLSLIPAESVLVVVRSGILSRTFPVAINKQPVTINQDMRAFVPKGDISTDYLAWQLIAKEQDILSACSKDGTTVASIEGPALANFPLLLAPAAEQTRIVEKLEELLSDLDAGVAELKAAQKKLGQYRQSLLKAAVEGALTAPWREQHTPTETGAQLLERILKERRARWEAKQLAKFEEQGKAPPKDWQKKYPEPVRPDTRELPALPEGWAWASLDQFLYQLRSGTAETSGRNATGFPVLKSSAVRQGHIDWEALNYLESHQIREDNFLEEGDLLLTRLSDSVEYVGCCAIASKIPENGIQYPDRIFCGKIASSDKEIAYYLTHCLFSPQARILIEAAAKSTAGHKRISLSDLLPFPIPLPPESELKVVCNQVAASLDQIRETGKAVEISLKQSAAQRKNILKAAFSGQLVPQDPGDEPAAVLLARIRAERAGHDPAKKPRGRKAKEAA